MSTPTTAQRWLSVRQAADYSGFAIRTILKKIARGELAAFIPRGSNSLRIDIADLDDMVTANGPARPR